MGAFGMEAFRLVCDRKNYTESEEEAHELIQKMMNEAGWKYEEKDVECYRNSEGEKIYYVEISNHEDNVYVLPDRFSYSTERGYVSLNQSDFCGDYKETTENCTKPAESWRSVR